VNHCHLCGSENVRLYGPGFCCPLHTPAKIAGRDEAYVDPELTLEALYAKRGIKHGYIINDSSLVDERAVTSGRRRANARIWKAAWAAEDARRATEKARRLK
jgi:hypothetical protein